MPLTLEFPTTEQVPGRVANSEVVELPLLLPRSQAEALETAARSRGMTTGQLLRRIIGDLFGKESTR